MNAGLHALLGNHVLIETPHATGSVIVVLCQLKQDSVVVKAGQRVAPGGPVGRCGNSGNSTEPHVHLHAVDGRDITRAKAVPIPFDGWLPRNGIIVEAPGNS